MEIIEFEGKRPTTNHILLTWSIKPLQNNINYIVMRALNDADKFKTIASGKATSYLDSDSVAIHNKFVRYKIKIGPVESKIVTPYNIGDPYILGIASDYFWQLKTGQGIKSYVFCKAETENYCPNCYDVVLKKRIKSVCNVCDGSGRLTGFKGPIETYINYAVIDEKFITIDNFEQETTYIQSWTGNIPILKRGDIVVRKTGERYIVNQKPKYSTMVSLKNNEKFIVRQTFILKELQKNYMAYKLKIPNW